MPNQLLSPVSSLPEGPTAQSATSFPCGSCSSPRTDLLAAGSPDLLVGASTSDDAAVYRINPSQALILTTDFFMPIVDDPRDFGRVAAANAIRWVVG